MSKKYYLCVTVGVGSIDNAYRPVLDDLNDYTGKSITSSNVVDFANDKALVLLSAVDHTGINSFLHPENPVTPDLIPAYSTLFLKSNIAAGDLTIINAALIKYGLNTNILTNAVTYGDILQGIGDALSVNFNLSNFDVRDRL